MARIVLAGYMVRLPIAGNILAYLQYVIGFERLGHEVLYLEESGWPYSAYDPTTREWQDHPATGLRTVRDLFERFDIKAPLVYVNRESKSVDGLTRPEFERWLRDADVLINIGGVCWLPELELVRRRAFIDLDPLFTQIDRFGAKVLGDYHVHFSCGANIGQPGCTIPTAGVSWRPTVPPVICDLWTVPPASLSAPFTTVANWSGYGTITYEGQEYGQKDREFLKIIDLPRLTTQPLELAVSGAPDDALLALREAGWRLRDAGQEVSIDVETYRGYITSSKGELSAAKHAYVATNSGWFSDRSVCYLAAGRPVVLQDTGFTRWLSTGEGVMAFRDVDEAAAALDHVNADYERHSAAARDIAQSIFSHAVVLPRIFTLAVEATEPCESSR